MDKGFDNSPEGITRRARYAHHHAKSEMGLLAEEVGPMMAISAMAAATMETAIASNIPPCSYFSVMIQVLAEADERRRRSSK